MADKRLQTEVEELRLRLEEAEETIEAIRSGAVDALVVSKPDGHRVYTLEGADRPYRILVERMQQGAVTLTADGAIAYCNRRFADLVRAPHEKVIGASLTDFLPATDLAPYDSLLRAAGSEGGQGEFSLRTSDGTLVPVYLTLNVMPPDSGTAHGLLVTDLTAQKNQEKLAIALDALRQTEARFRRAMLEIAIPTLLHADDGEVLLVNKVWSDITGYQLADIPTIKHWTTKAYGEQHATAEQYIDSLFDADERVDSGTWAVKTAAGEVRTWHFFTTPLGSEPEGRRLLVSNAIDVTERKRLEEELREVAADLADANRRKDEFLATLAHELRNPLAPIRNSLQIMRLAGADATMVEQARQMAERQVQQMVRLVDDLLDVSRITLNKLELRKRRVNLAAVVQSAVETNQVAIEMAGHELTVSLPPGELWLDADPTRLAQVLANLLNNAAKYTGGRGHIWLTVDVEDSGNGRQEVVIRVRDTGIGIPAAMLPRIFDMFVQVDGSMERAQGGLGIGLTLVKRLVEMHGGTVHAASAGTDQGSEFVVRLPLAADQSRAVVDADDGRQRSAVTPRRVLVVDDNADAANSLTLLLRMMGHEVRTVGDGQAALDVTQSFRPDLVLLDIGLPGMSGYEVARLLRRSPALRETWLVALTGWGQEEDRRRAKEYGFDHHLTKPADPADLKRLLASVPSDGSVA